MPLSHLRLSYLFLIGLMENRFIELFRRSFLGDVLTLFSESSALTLELFCRLVGDNFLKEGMIDNDVINLLSIHQRSGRC